MLTSLFGLKINGLEVDAVGPELFFTSPEKEEVTYFYPKVLELKNFGNFEKSYESLKKWLNDEKALFHHNWNLKERELISYIHPDNLEKLSEILLEDGKENNFIDLKHSKSREALEKQNIFSLGLIMLQICLLEPFICSKLYNATIFKSEQKKGPTEKKEMKYSYQKDNLTIKFNHSLLQKYLIQMKTRYSEEFVDLIQFMLLGENNNKSLANNTIYQPFNYETVIEKLSHLIDENLFKLKEVYSESQKSKSKAKESRKSSLTKQVSYSNVSNPSLSSSSSLSMFPVQSQQKASSVELLKKNCERLENKVDKVLIKSELETMQEPFAKKETKLESLISKDEERILSQLNQLNVIENFDKKQKRFGYRKIDEKNVSNDLDNTKKLGLENPNNWSFDKLEFQNYGDFKINTPASLLPKMDSISQEKEKRFNSSSKIKKNMIQKAREEESMGNSVCQTVFFNKERPKNEESTETIKNRNFDKISDYKNYTHFEIESFEENPNNNFSYKSELKNLMVNKDKKIKTENLQSYENEEEKSPKELKSNQLYEIYLKEYRNLVESQRKNEF